MTALDLDLDLEETGIPPEDCDEECMTAKEKAKEIERLVERDWVRGEIAAAVDSLKPRGWHYALLLAGRVGGVASYLSFALAMFLGLATAIYAAWTQHTAATAYATARAVFETNTTNEFAKIDKRLDHLEETVANIQLTLTLLRPLNAQSVSAIATVAQGAIEQHSKLDPALVQDVSKELSKSPLLAGAWNATSRLVTYRYQATNVAATQNGNCLKEPLAPGIVESLTWSDPQGRILERRPLGSIPESKYTGVSATLLLHDCTIDLEALAEYKGSDIAQFFTSTLDNQKGRTYSRMVLTRARIVYHGGAMIPVNVFELHDCTLDFQIQTPPPLRGQRLTNQLLLAENPKAATATILGS